MEGLTVRHQPGGTDCPLSHAGSVLVGLPAGFTVIDQFHKHSTEGLYTANYVFAHKLIQRTNIVHNRIDLSDESKLSLVAVVCGFKFSVF